MDIFDPFSLHLGSFDWGTREWFNLFLFSFFCKCVEVVQRFESDSPLTTWFHITTKKGKRIKWLFINRNQFFWHIQSILSNFKKFQLTKLCIYHVKIYNFSETWHVNRWTLETLTKNRKNHSQKHEMSVKNVKNSNILHRVYLRANLIFRTFSTQILVTW